MLSSVLTGISRRIVSVVSPLPKSMKPQHGDQQVDRAEAERVLARACARQQQAERAGDDVDHVVPAVDRHPGERLGLDRVADLEAGVDEEAEDAGDDERAADERRVEPGRAWSIHRIPPSDSTGSLSSATDTAVGDPSRMAGRSLNRIQMPIRRERAERLADEDLMPLIADRDPEAFEVFYDRHGGAAYSLAYRIVGSRGAAEDVTQEAFISIWRSGARFDRTRGSVRAWTLGIVRNRAIDVAAPGGRQGAEADLRRRGDPRAAALRGPDRRRGAARARRQRAARRAGRAAQRAVEGDPARLLRRLQPLGDRRRCSGCRWGRSRAGCGWGWRRSAGRRLAEGLS